MTDMYQPIRYTRGHECRHNGTGDYEFVCPKVPNGAPVMPFVPYLARSTLRGDCPYCNETIEPEDEA